MLKLSTRLAIAMVSLVLVTTIALGVITYLNITRLGLPRSLERLETQALLNATQLEIALNSARADLMALRSSGAVADFGTAYTQSLVDPSMIETSQMWIRRISVRLSAEMLAKSHYAQMRIIGRESGGRELVRVNRSGPDGAIRVVPDDELAPMGDSSYFKNAIDLSARDVYVSPVQMHTASGAIGRGPSPNVRVAASLRATDGKPFAVGVIDVDLQPEFDRIRASMGRGRQIYIVNAQGDCLLGPDPSSSQAAMNAPARIQKQFPRFAEEMASGRTNGIWVDSEGARHVVGWASVQLAGGPLITVIEAASYPVVNVGFTAVGDSTLWGGALAVLFAICVAVLLARSLSRPLVEITRAVEGFSRGEAIQLSPSGGKEIEVLSAAISKMAADVRQKSALLTNVITTIADPVLVVDEHGTIVIANPAARSMFAARPGLSFVPCTGLQFSLFCPDGVTPFPQDQSAIAQALQRRSVDNLHILVRPAAGEDRDIVVSGRPIIDEAGVLCGAVTIYRDITIKLKAQQAQFASEQMAQSIIDTALDAFIQIDGHGKILFWSPKAEDMLGWSRDEAIGKNVNDLSICGDKNISSQERIAQALRSLDSGGVSGWRYETVTLHRDRTEIATEISLTALRRRDDVIINTFLRDISQSRVAEEQLRQAQKMESVGELTGGLAHDFNNMLTVITGTIDILADAVSDKPQLAAIAALISGAADRGAELTANLLAFARKQPLQPRSTDVNSLMTDVCKLLHPTLGRQIEVETELGSDVWPALVDPGQLSSALVNLAINARDAMPDGGKLVLTTGNIEIPTRDMNFKGILTPGAYVRISVRDTGVGMSDAVLEKVFEPFFSTKEPGRGTGLGLSMVYGFVKQSGGHIEANSELGHGTTFRIYLPKAVIQPDSVEDEPSDSHTASGHEIILCVEDDASVRSFVLTQLQSLGYKTVTAANAAEALTIVDSGEPFDLLFTDIVMPGKMNGRQLAEEVAQRRPALKVLFTSGFTENDDVINHSHMTGEVLLLPKPYRRADLNRMIRLALEAPTPAVILSRSANGSS